MNTSFILLGIAFVILFITYIMANSRFEIEKEEKNEIIKNQEKEILKLTDELNNTIANYHSTQKRLDEVLAKLEEQKPKVVKDVRKKKEKTNE